jgi:hypothetical protein
MPELKLPNHDRNIDHIQTQYALLFKSTEKAWELALKVLPEEVPLDAGRPFLLPPFCSSPDLAGVVVPSGRP